MNLGELELKFLDGIKNVPSAKEKAFITLNPIEMIKTLTAKYGKDWIIWDNVETLYKNIESDFVPGYSRNEVYWMHKDFINALKVMCRSDDFWIDWMVFEKCCKGVSQEVVDFGTIQSCSPGQCLLGMKVAEFIRNEEFDPEVKSYIAACCKSRGLVYLPESLSIAQKELDSLGNDLELKSKSEQIWSKIITDGRIEPEEIMLTEDRPEDNQVAKMYAIKKYVDEKLGESNVSDSK